MQLQLHRMKIVAGTVQFHDRSLVCTAALAEYLGYPIPAALHQAIIDARDLFEPRVFFVRLLGFITPTSARRITLEQSQQFEAVHESIYRRLGFDLEYVQPADIDTRIRSILAAI